MSYRCARCHSVTPSGQPQKRLVVYRWVKKNPEDPSSVLRKETEREVPLCLTCYENSTNSPQPQGAEEKPQS